MLLVNKDLHNGLIVIVIIIHAVITTAALLLFRGAPVKYSTLCHTGSQLQLTGSHARGTIYSVVFELSHKLLIYKADGTVLSR